MQSSHVNWHLLYNKLYNMEDPEALCPACIFKYSLINGCYNSMLKSSAQIKVQAVQ